MIESTFPGPDSSLEEDLEVEALLEQDAPAARASRVYPWAASALKEAYRKGWSSLGWEALSAYQQADLLKAGLADALAFAEGPGEDWILVPDPHAKGVLGRLLALRSQDPCLPGYAAGGRRINQYGVAFRRTPVGFRVDVHLGSRSRSFSFSAFSV